LWYFVLQVFPPAQGIVLAIPGKELQLELEHHSLILLVYKQAPHHQRIIWVTFGPKAHPIQSWRGERSEGI
jgi:hypothetical protein